MSVCLCVCVRLFVCSHVCVCVARVFMCVCVCVCVCSIAMAFNVTYHDLLSKNIRHIYSSLPSNVRFRCDPVPGVTLNPHDGCLSPQKRFPPPPRAISERLYRSVH